MGRGGEEGGGEAEEGVVATVATFEYGGTIFITSSDDIYNQFRCSFQWASSSMIWSICLQGEHECTGREHESTHLPLNQLMNVLM